jgi:hypothetical protein
MPRWGGGKKLSSPPNHQDKEEKRRVLWLTRRRHAVDAAFSKCQPAYNAIKQHPGWQYKIEERRRRRSSANFTFHLWHLHPRTAVIITLLGCSGTLSQRQRAAEKLNIRRRPVIHGAQVENSRQHLSRTRRDLSKRTFARGEHRTQIFCCKRWSIFTLTRQKNV